MAKLKIGWAEVSITPDKKIALAGQFAERISEYVETPIAVTALAVESDGEQMIICSCDLIGVNENLVNAVRDMVKLHNREIDTEKIIISAIHSHTSYVYDYGEDSNTEITISSVQYANLMKFQIKLTFVRLDIMVYV